LSLVLSLVSQLVPVHGTGEEYWSPVSSAEWEGSRGRLLPLSGCSSTSATHQLVDPAEWKHAGEILRTFREIADPDPAWGMPTRESIHSEIKMGRERREVEISRAARRSPKPRHIAAEQPRYLTVEELTLRLGLRDPDDPPAKRRILTVDELTVCLGLMNGQENRRNRTPRSRTRVAE
jgi:hypothetical protein